MSRFAVVIDFAFDANDKLVIPTKVYFNDTNLDLTLSEFLQFIYQHQKELHQEESAFCTSLAKLVKKVTLENGETTFAIARETDQFFFFKRAREFVVPIYFKSVSEETQLDYQAPLPFVVQLHQMGQKVKAVLVDQQRWASNPFSFLCFTFQKETYVIAGHTLLKVAHIPLLIFLERLIDQSTLTFAGDKAKEFLETIYQKSQKLVIWENDVDLDAFIPREMAPIPVLKLVYNEPILMPQLLYQYEQTVVEPNSDITFIESKLTGKKYLRSKLESIYQQDLISLFEEHDVPLMLQNPEDIQKFLKNIVPELGKRDWEIQSEVPDFKIISEATPVQFSLSTTQGNSNWFEFGNYIDVLGQSIPLPEMARMLVENQGFVKTDKGFVKIDENSQNAVDYILGLKQSGKTQFEKLELLPVLLGAQVKGTDENAVTVSEALGKIKAIEPPALPNTFKASLRSYQEQGYHWLKTLQENQLGGVLADDMGLGKTVQALALASTIIGNGPILMIGPTNVIFNWKQEIEKFLPSAKHTVYSGGNRHQKIEELLNQDIIITSFGILKNDINWLKSIPYQAIFIDEAQAIKNPQTQLSDAVKQLQANFRLAMTGTPVENHLQDLWNLFDFVLPGYLGSQSGFLETVKGSQLKPLRTRIAPFILRRTKEEVLDTLPSKTELIVKCPLSDAQKKLYKTVLDSAKKGIRTASGKTEKLAILAALLKLRQACLHPNLIQEFKDLAQMPSTKFDIFKEKISDLLEEGHKVVVFSQFTGMLDIAEKWLRSGNMAFERIDGSISGKQRLDAVNRFQETETPTVFLISLKAGGVGINLTSADYVIHLDPWWNPAIESQATDRVHRYGQTNKVFVLKFIAEDTIEESILELQESKRELFSQLITETETPPDLSEVKTLLLNAN